MRKRTKDGYRTLLAVLEREAGQVRKVAERNKQAAGRLEAGAKEWMDYVVVAHGKTDALQTRLPGLLSMFFAAHGRFTRFLEETECAIDE